MKITAAQQEDIRAVLWHNIKYRETFDELYDHILTCIEEHEEDGVKPHDIARYIIHNEFGGWEKLKELEITREKGIRGRMWSKVWVYMKAYFSFPLLLFTLLAAGGIYYMASHVPRSVVFVVMYVIALTPALMSGRIMPFNRWSKKYKASLYEGIAERFGTIGLAVFNWWVFMPSILLNDEHYRFFRQAHASLLMLITITWLIYALSIIKVFKEDFKLSVVK